MRANRIVGEPKLARQLLNRGHATAQERRYLPLGASKEPLIPASRHDSDAPLVAFSLPPDDRFVNIVKKHIDEMDTAAMLVARWPRVAGRSRKPAVGAGRRTR